MVIPLAGITLRSFVETWGEGIALAEVLTLDHYRELLEYPNVVRAMVNTLGIGHIGGAAAVMKRMGDDIVGAFPSDVRGTPLAQIPLFKGLHSLKQVGVVVTVATGIIGEYWITQAHQQSGVPIIIGPTAVGAPRHGSGRRP